MNRRSALVSLLAAVLLAGCSGGSGGKPSALPTLTATPPTATPAPVPAAAKPATPLAAAAFVRYWFETLDLAFQSGTVFPVDALSDAKCASCRNFSDIAAALARDGYHFTGPSFTNLDAQSPPLQGGLVFVTFTCDLPARTKVDRAGKIVLRYPAEKRLLMTVTTERRGDAWVVRSLKAEA